MRITSGRGNNRKSFVFPHAEIVNRSSPSEQKAARNLICDFAGIPLPIVEPVCYAK